MFALPSEDVIFS